jgi:hypothetical protein
MTVLGANLVMSLHALAGREYTTRNHEKSAQTFQCTIQASYIRSFTEFCLRLKQEEKIKVV